MVATSHCTGPVQRAALLLHLLSIATSQLAELLLPVAQDPSTVPPEWHAWLHYISDENAVNVSLRTTNALCFLFLRGSWVDGHCYISDENAVKVS